ncbi:MAG: hypothetical protein M1402_04480 [Candidatus Thermoplasmatota archaeon]|nr:hypothetical protein [Candidatus Thermoplasmatota archaeon]MCL5666095.1 hypothetical protein [Candidatus Thermoplasmatota archaeon]
MEENEGKVLKKNERKKGGFFKRFRRAAAKKRESKTVIKVRSVGDIPPIVNARKLVGDGNMQEAIKRGFNRAKQDYCSQFSVTPSPSDTNRQFLIREFALNGINIPDEAYLDNSLFSEAMNKGSEIPQWNKNRIMALRKLTAFYLDYYEKARFQGPVKDDPNTVIEKLTDVYNYLDIMKLYYTQMNGEEEEVG